MNDQLVVQHLLQRKLFEARSKNPSFSLRAFAKKLKIGAGPLSQILSGNRRVSMKMAARFCDALLLDPTEKDLVVKHFLDRQAQKQKIQDIEETLRVTADQFRVISEWYNYALFSLVRTKDFKNDPQWIANRLGISRLEAQQAVERLQRLDMLKIDADGNVSTAKPTFTTDDEVTNLSVRMANLKGLDLAKASLERDPIHLRDFTSWVIPTNLSALPKAKKLIRRFHQQMRKLLESAPEKTEVYRVSVEMFPLTRLPAVNQQPETATQSDIIEGQTP